MGQDIEVQDLIITADGDGGGNLIILYPLDETMAAMVLPIDASIKTTRGIEQQLEEI